MFVQQECPTCGIEDSSAEVFRRTVGRVSGDRRQDEGGGAAVPVRERRGRHGRSGAGAGGARRRAAPRAGARRRPAAAARARHARAALRARITPHPARRRTAVASRIADISETDATAVREAQSRPYAAKVHLGQGAN